MAKKVAKKGTKRKAAPKTASKAPLSDEARAAIVNFVRSGFYSNQELRECFCEFNDFEWRAVKAVIDREVARVLDEQRTWPKETDCDRLDRVFDSLNASGLIALQNAGPTLTDGYYDVEDEQDRRKGERVDGYCFYHQQDLEGAVRGAGLYLAFGLIDGSRTQTEGAAIGRRVVDALANEGFAVEWDGTVQHRILVKLDWKRRRRG
jgi:hypothetical protein